MSDSKLLVITEGEILTYPPRKQFPFDLSKTSKIGWGGYSTVHKEVIAIRHFKYKPKPSQTSAVLNETPLPVARKTFPYTPDFDREYAFLQKLNASPHRHTGVIQELAVLIYDDKYHLLLPLADSDLEKLQSSIDLSTFSLKDLLDQILNVVDAVSWLHSGIYSPDGKTLTACHMDLKPENILVLHHGTQSPTGTWIVTDFSTSTLTTETGEELLSAPRLVAGVYSAPEIQKQPEQNKASPECDVWSLGCILFEILLGFVDGREDSMKWKDYWGNMPCFYEGETGRRVLASRVQRWLAEDVSTKVAGTQVVKSYKNLILSVLRIESTERPTAEGLKESLASIFRQN